MYLKVYREEEKNLQQSPENSLFLSVWFAPTMLPLGPLGPFPLSCSLRTGRGELPLLPPQCLAEVSLGEMLLIDLFLDLFP